MIESSSTIYPIWKVFINMLLHVGLPTRIVCGRILQSLMFETKWYKCNTWRVQTRHVLFRICECVLMEASVFPRLEKKEDI